MSKEIFDWTSQSRPGHLINRLARLFVRVGDSRLKALGVASGQMPVLAALRDGHALSQKELASFARIEQPTMAQTLARMERDGIVQRHADPNDKRSSLISLTPLAVEKAPQIIAVLQQGNDEALEGFSDEEKEMLVSLLRRIVVNLEAIVARDGHE